MMKGGEKKYGDTNWETYKCWYWERNSERNSAGERDVLDS